MSSTTTKGHHMKATQEQTYTVMIGDAGGSEVYRTGLTLERAREMVEACAHHNKTNDSGYVLWISI